MTTQETSTPEHDATGREAPEVHRGSGPQSADAGGAAPARQRIAKAMARAGLCSRREAEAWVLAGRVKINGELLESPARDVSPDDVVTVDDAPLPAVEKTRLFLFHKPRGLVTSDYDPEGRETVMDFLRENWPEGPRVVTIGRLDINTEGLLLLTNDGGLARVLELPETGWMRRYRVRAKGVADPSALDALAEGISIEGVDYAGIEARLDRVQGHNCWLTMGLREGKNREIKRILEHLGLEVNRLIRLSFGPFQLQELPDGAVEEVRTRVLRDQLGAALAAEAGAFFGHEEPVQAAAAPRTARKDDEGRRRPRTSAAAPQSRSDRSTADVPRADRGSRGERSQDPDGRRRHVTASRTMDEQRARFGPRKRIERSDTKDRNDRKVSVERMVVSGEPPRGRSSRDGSPSAQGKRARVARSSAASTKGSSRGARDNKPAFRRSEEGRRPSERSGRPATGANRSDGQRRSETGAPNRPSRFAERSGESRPPRARPAEFDRGASDKPRGRSPRVFRSGEQEPRGEAYEKRPRAPYGAAGRKESRPREDGRSDRAGSPRKPGRGPRPSGPPKR